MARAQEYNPEPVMKGDHWNGFQITGVLVNGGAPASAAQDAVLEFYDNPQGHGVPVHEVKKSDSNITFENAATWAMTIIRQVLPLRAGRWYMRLRVTRADGVKKTYVKGILIIE